MAKTESKTVIGCDNYGREANLSISKDKKTGKVSILSSEEGDPVVYSPKQVKELIEALQWSLKV